MPSRRTRRDAPRPARLVALALLGLAAPCLARPPLAGAAPPDCILKTIRPDYERFIGAVRPLARPASRDEGPRRIYMALVRPGASDPGRSDSAPYVGAGARNDVLYDSASVGGGRSAAWALLLLDHEYFHARHLAGATSLPLPGPVGPEVERHFYEAAAWGFNVSEARAGRYAGLRPDEFREALDRYGEHYAALRALVQKNDPGRWSSFADLLRHPASLVRTSGRRLAEDPARPSGSDRSRATP